jgi:DNA-binding CsgD family transcriptional regulator
MHAAGFSEQPPGGAMPPRLTEREVDLLQRVAAGQSSRDIAGDLGLSRSTVRDAWENAQRKLALALEYQERCRER